MGGQWGEGSGTAGGGEWTVGDWGRRGRGGSAWEGDGQRGWEGGWAHGGRWCGEGSGHRENEGRGKGRGDAWREMGSAAAVGGERRKMTIYIYINK
ncbi:UNVERIFIED_CONTAM: hypothetical protein Sradi_0855900 [Sesamum radiatum]|uniref:Uncharacterized protein n=1 Tax=Sesamum radiatum TaxID=300843 RepID=A0AAW2V4D9_SESRA